MRSLMSLSLIVLLAGPCLAQSTTPAPGAVPEASAPTQGLEPPLGARQRHAPTQEAFVARGEARLLRADADGDGRVSLAEWMSYAARSGMKGRPERQFARLDTNHDGVLDKAEIDAMLAQRFARRDTNGDGLLTADERHHRTAPKP